MFYQANLERRKSVIIFDEVQFCPCARQVIKHLVADHRYDYIETGLFVTLMFFDSDFVENDIYVKLLSGRGACQPRLSVRKYHCPGAGGAGVSPVLLYFPQGAKQAAL